MDNGTIQLLLLNIFSYFFTFGGTHQLFQLHCDTRKGSECVFRNINQVEFIPLVENEEEINTVLVKDSKFLILSSMFCSTFSNLKKLSINKSNLRTVQIDALQNCKYLEEFSIEDNDVETLPNELFEFNYNLRVINLSGNQLKHLPHSLFTNKSKLVKLLLSSNKLTYFIEERMQELSNLVELRVDSNELSDLKEKEITKNLPNLQRIAITDNDFSCFRLEQMILHYHSNLINFICEVKQSLRHRDYDYRQIYCFEYPDVNIPMRCLLDEQWEFEKICKMRCEDCGIQK